MAAPGDRVGALPRSRSPPRSGAALLGGSRRSRRSRRTCGARSSGRSSSRSRGWTSLVPMLDEAIELAAAAGAHEIVIGIAHRGRLNVLAHTVGRSYASILREFEGERTIDALVSDPEGGHRATSSTTSRHRSRVQTDGGRDPGHRRGQPEPPRGGRPRRRGPRARRADRSLARRGHPRPDRRAPDPDPRRRVVRRARASSPRRSTSTRSTATRPAGRCTSSRTTRSASRPIPPRAARRATRATSRRASTSRSSTSTPTTPRLRSPRSGSRSPTARSSATTS